VSYLGIGEGDGGDLATILSAIASGEIVADDAEVVIGGVGEVGGAGAVADGPDARGGGFEAVVDLEVAGGSRFDADSVEVHVLRVRHASGGDEDV